MWGGQSPAYLAGTPDAGPAKDAHVEWSFDTRLAALRDAVNGDSRTAIGAKLTAIEVTSRDSAGRAEQVTLRGSREVTVRGEIFREVVTAPSAFKRCGARSSRFDGQETISYSTDVASATALGCARPAPSPG